MELRPYQIEAINQLRSSIGTGHRRPLLQLPTGGGKTLLASEVIRGAIDKRNKVLFLAPRRELIYQASQAFHRRNIHNGIFMAGVRRVYSGVQVASFDTLHARCARGGHDYPEASLVVVDEGHLSISRTRKQILDRYADQGAVVIGLTATPARGDGRGLGEFYDDLICSWSIQKLIEHGYLCPVRYFAPSVPDLSSAQLGANGDYRESDLDRIMDQGELVGDIVTNWRRIANGKSTVVFCSSKAHSRHVCNEFLAAGVTAEHLDSDTPEDERKQIFDRVRTGHTRVLCNVYIASYGLDIPSLEVAVMARPTKSLVLYMQTIGRILRPFEGKESAIVIDHSGCVQEHGFVDDEIPWSLESDTSVKDRKENEKRERKEPKEVTCSKCATVFKGRRDCPMCGFQLIPPAEAVPHHEHELKEIKPKQLNHKTSKHEKQRFYSEILGYCRINGKKEGMAAHVYKRRFGVFPNAMQKCSAKPSEETVRHIKSSLIAYAKRRTV